MILKGIPASPGIAIGRTFLFDTRRIIVPTKKIREDLVPREIARFEEALIKTRAEILDIHARRAAKEGYSYHINREEYAAFASAFPFEETEDQQKAIDAVIEDLSAPIAMDRVVCGDVGFAVYPGHGTDQRTGYGDHSLVWR